jgi:hypothetical protein
MVMGLYFRSYTGTPQASTSSVWSLTSFWQKNIRITQNSQTALSLYSYQGTNSSVSSGSTTVGSNDSFVGTRALDMHSATTNGQSLTQMIPSGDYLLLWGVTKKTSGGADVWGGIDTVLNFLSVSNSAYFSYGDFGSTATSMMPYPGAAGGFFSTTSQTSFSQTSASAAGQTYADGSLLPTTLVNSQVTGVASGWRSLVPYFYMTASV